jgi:ceramide glucosyltransferase
VTLSGMAELVFEVLAGFAIAAVVVTLLMSAATHRVLSRSRCSQALLPPVTIMKPLKGVDDELYENLASLARQDYPAFEIIFGAEDPADPALAVARRVQADYPQVRIRVVSRARPFGFNPKVVNLAHMSKFATFDYVLISDSNVRARPNYLRTLAAELADERVGLVHSVLVGTHERSLGAVFENLHLASFVVSAVCGTEGIARRPCVIGKSMLLRQSHLAELGGWASVKDVLAEDYVLGERFHRAGHRVALSVLPLATVTHDRPVRDFANRHVRWAQMRRHIAPGVYCAELLANPLPLLGLAMAVAWVTDVPHSAPILLTMLAGTLLKLASDASLFSRLRGQRMPLKYLALVPVKDALVLGIWLYGGLKRTILWRGNRMRIGAGSVLSAPPGEFARAELLEHRV